MLHKSNARDSNNHDSYHLTVPQKLQRHGSMQSVASGLSGHSEMSESGKFEIPPAHMRKQRRQQRRVVVTGKDNNQRVRGAPEPIRELFIYRVHPETTTEALKNYVSDKGFSIGHLECISNSEAKFKSFKLSLPISEFNRTLDENMWPSGVRVRRFFSNRKKEET